MSKSNSKKCPNCGGTLKFNPNTQQITCIYCQSSFSPDFYEEVKAKDLASRFNKNFAKYEGNEAGKALVKAGPQL